MSDIRNLSGTSVDTGVSAPVSEVSDAGEVLEKDQLAFHDALAKGGEPHESQSPETRKAIKRSLDRFQASSETEGASRSSESEVADASRGRSTRLTAGRPAGAVARDGPVPARGTRRAADAGGTKSVTARGRSRGTTPAAPPVVSAADSLPSTKQSRATTDRKLAGAAPEGVLAPGRARAGSAVEAARTVPTTSAQTAPPRDPGGSSAPRTEDIASGPGADDAHDPDIEAVDMTGVAASAGTAELGRTSAPEGVQAPVSRATELAEQVADRILVSMPDSSAPGEVRISLKQSILDGSDVRIFHEGGELRVVFVAETESAQRLLVNIREQFQQTLGERLQDQRVHVEVEAPARGGASREDSRGRSRQQYVRQDDSSGAS